MTLLERLETIHQSLKRCASALDTQRSQADRYTDELGTVIYKQRDIRDALEAMDYTVGVVRGLAQAGQITESHVPPVLREASDAVTTIDNANFLDGMRVWWPNDTVCLLIYKSACGLQTAAVKAST